MQKTKKSRVLYIGGFELPDKNAAAHRVIANAKILESLGHEVVLIGIDKSLKSEVPFLGTRQTYNGFVYYSIPYPKTIVQWLIYLSNIDFIHLLIEYTPTHIIAYNFPSLGLKRLVSFGKKNNIKIIGDCTEWYQGTGNFLHKIIKEIDVYWRMKFLHFKLDGLIVISDYLESFYKNRVTNIINIPPLVDLSLPKWPKTVLKHTQGESLVIVYAGSPGMGNKDRLDWIIKTLGDINRNTNRGIEFRIMGITEEQYHHIFPKNEKFTLDRDFVKFLGRIDHLEVLKELNRADFQLFLREENRVNNAGFPTKFTESVSCGTPVLTNSTSNISKFLIERKNGFLVQIGTDEVLYKSLLCALNLSSHDIYKMKTFSLESRMFHFENYTKGFKLFFEKID